VFDLLRARSATLCATDLDDQAPPDLRLTGRAIYLRLRRSAYRADDIAAWATRLAPFLADDIDCFVFFRHDAGGRFALHAEQLAALIGSP